MIKAVIFDIDGVLINSLDANYKFFGDLMNKFGYGFMTKDEYTHLFHAPMKDIVRISTKSTNEEEIEKIWKAGKDREVRYPDELLSSPSDLERVIGLLSKDYTLGIVTGRVRSSIFSIPHLKSIRQYFKIDVSYEDTKNHKPNPDPLILAAKKLGFLSEECVYVGDAESDVIAAKAAGMKSVVYSKNKISSADANTSSFGELPKIIKSI